MDELEQADKDYEEMEAKIAELEADLKAAPFYEEYKDTANVLSVLRADVAALSKTNRELIRDATHGIDKAQAIRDMVEECFVGDLYELRTSILYYADKLEQK